MRGWACLLLLLLVGLAGADLLLPPPTVNVTLQLPRPPAPLAARRTAGSGSNTSISSLLLNEPRRWSWTQIAAFASALPAASANYANAVGGWCTGCYAESATQGVDSTLLVVNCECLVDVVLAMRQTFAFRASLDAERAAFGDELLVMSAAETSVVDSNAVFHTSTPIWLQQTSAPLHLDRIDQRGSDSYDALYRYYGDGTGVTVYMVDTGVRATHVEFLPAGRVVNVLNTIDGQANTALIKVLAEHFNVPKNSISILGGKSARLKMIEIC